MPPIEDKDSFVTKEFCAEHHAAADQRLVRIEGTVDSIYKKLCVDNGNPSFQTRLDRHDQQLGVLRWGGAIVIGTLVVIGVKLLLVNQVPRMVL